MPKYVQGAATLRIMQAKQMLQPVPLDETVTVRILIEDAFGRFIDGSLTKEDWESVASALNMALAIDTMVDKSSNKLVINDAMAAMQEVGRNGLATNKRTLDLIRKAVALHHAQLDDITRGQYETAIQYAISQYRKKAYTYKVVDETHEN